MQLFCEMVSPELVGRRVSIEYIRDPRMVCGQFFGSWFNVNLAKHNVTHWQTNIELMLHELAHTVVQSNDHLHHDFHETIGRLGAKLAIIAATCTMPLFHPLQQCDTELLQKREYQENPPRGMASR